MNPITSKKNDGIANPGEPLAPREGPVFPYAGSISSAEPTHRDEPLYGQ